MKRRFASPTYTPYTGKESTMNRACARCGREVGHEGKVGIRDSCDGCLSDLHVCLNCRFHDPRAKNESRETQAEPVREKDKANYCEWFVFREGTGGEGLEKLE